MMHTSLALTQRMSAKRWLALKKFGYLIALSSVTLPFVAYLGASYMGHWDAWAFYVPFINFGVIPLLDWLIGKDPVNHHSDDEAALKHERYYYALLVLCLPLQLGMLVFGAWVLATAPFSLLGQIMWVVSIGFVGGVNAINTGHELIHKPNVWLQRTGGLLLACVGYASFKVEHVYGHHIHAATPHDNSTARLGESAYAFLARAYRHNLPDAFTLERENFKRRGQTFSWLKSELLGWYAFSLVLLVAFTVVWGALGAAYFIGQCVFAIALLELVNYLEHYGLLREKQANGHYERVNPTHSWNSNFLLTNLFLFQLQRHSDHHAYAARPYQTLRHFDESPQLPFGYATMIVLALVPPLWRRVMDPRALAYQQQRSSVQT
jgi:alkane 1-monooxygenase